MLSISPVILPLGVNLTNKLLSNIDNVFFGRAINAMGLAALLPATLRIDKLISAYFHYHGCHIRTSRVQHIPNEI